MTATVVLPFRGEFGLKVYYHVPAVHAIGPDVIYCERGEEALYPSADRYVQVERNADGRRRNKYRRDRDFVSHAERDARNRFTDPELLTPGWDAPRERFIPEPVETHGITCDVLVCPRKRDYGAAKNWPHWTWLTEQLQAEGLDVFAGGAPDSSYEVPCPRAWEYERFLDATLEAMHAADLVIATDAGLAHLAVLCGRPLKIISYRDGIVAPGPNVNERGRKLADEFWPIHRHRYEEGAHTGSPWEIMPYTWNDPERVLEAAVGPVAA